MKEIKGKMESGEEYGIDQIRNLGIFFDGFIKINFFFEMEGKRIQKEYKKIREEVFKKLKLQREYFEN